MASTKNIEIHNARVNNLKGISIDIPRNKLIVITGVSGSGKSSLAFDTLYAEGQRRYVESLNSYARQFLGRNNKPEVDYIKGIPPAIAIEQKVNTRNPRSTVGTQTEIYDYLRLLFARIGRTISPISGAVVKRDTVTDVVNFVTSLPQGTKVAIITDIKIPNGSTLTQVLKNIIQQGFSRVEQDGNFVRLSDDELPNLAASKTPLHLVVDRLAANTEADTITRLSDSVATAFYEGHGALIVRTFAADNSFTDTAFSDRFEADGMAFEEPSEQLFMFNSPMGACPRCEGFGRVIGIDENLVIPNKGLSVAEECVACWHGTKLSEWNRDFMLAVRKKNFPVHSPYYELTQEQKDLLWHGAPGIYGIDDFFKFAESQQYKIQYRVLLARYRGKTICPECHGARLRKEALYVQVAGKTIAEVVSMPISKLREWVNSITLNEYEAKIAERLLTEIRTRVEYLYEVGLEYLTLDRLSSTLSGGESQRINIATSLGSSLVGSLYVLDEPSIGLHSADTEKLISVLRKLQKLGNTVVVVEHEEEIIRAADMIIDIGPEAGRLGGQVVFAGDFEQMKSADTLTIKYLRGELSIPTPKSRRSWTHSIRLSHVTDNNLKNLNVEIPLNVLTVVTGVSGSGKSTLVSRVFYPALCKAKGMNIGEHFSSNCSIDGCIDAVGSVEFIDQNPIGKSSRSNPITYLGIYDDIRKLMCSQQLAKQNGYTAAHFSFNAAGGRCEECQGEGFIKIEMQFMADITLECPQCHGRRFKDDVLEVKYRDKSIADILDMTVNQAIEFFSESTAALEKRIVNRLKPLQDVGLGYIKMGQSSSTLSGGESQRVKLAYFLAGETTTPTLFIFDEPTTGLHFHDISKLMKAFQSLIEHGHTLLVIEHNLDVIKCADWVIDLGPVGGENGGYIIAQGTPEDVAKCKDSKTGKYLIDKLK